MASGLGLAGATLENLCQAACRVVPTASPISSHVRP